MLEWRQKTKYKIPKQEIEMEILRALESIRTPFLDELILLITRMGEQMIIIAVFCAIFWCINKRMAYVLGIVFFMSAILVQGMKIVFRVDRPWVYDPSFTTVPGAVGAATGYAFPSGHTQNAAAYLMPLGVMLKNKIVRIILFGLALLVAFSRMYLGVHYLSDVLVSLLIVAVILWFAIKFYYNAPENNKTEALFPLIICAATIAIFAMVIIMNLAEVTEPAKLRDSVLAGGAAAGFAVGMFIEKKYINFSVKSKNVFMQILKLILGLAGTIGIMEGARILGSGLVADAIRYGLTTLWITAIYPLLIKRFLSVKEKN
jgi:undecaprenyl-diphosphatase